MSLRMWAHDILLAGKAPPAILAGVPYSELSPEINRVIFYEIQFIRRFDALKMIECLTYWQMWKLQECLVQWMLKPGVDLKLPVLGRQWWTVAIEGWVSIPNLHSSGASKPGFPANREVASEMSVKHCFYQERIQLQTDTKASNESLCINAYRMLAFNLDPYGNFFSNELATNIRSKLWVTKCSVVARTGPWNRRVHKWKNRWNPNQVCESSWEWCTSVNFLVVIDIRWLCRMLTLGEAGWGGYRQPLD